MKSWQQHVSKLFLVVLSVLFLLPVGSSKASVDDFVVHSFDATYQLSRDDPQGLMTITEKIDLSFNDYNHGILRAIPAKYDGNDTNPRVISITRDGVSEPFTSYSSNDNIVLQIGNAAKTITGSHNYEIKYFVENVIKFYDDHDELYWDINGDQWLQSFESVTAELLIPSGLKLLPADIRFAMRAVTAKLPQLTKTAKLAVLLTVVSRQVPPKN